MSERPIADVGPLACPFVAFEHDQARRSVEPDRRHRCYAESVPAPRAISHQTTYCLSSGFAACPTFRAWAQRTAARQAEERYEASSRPAREVPVAPMPQAPDFAAMGLVADDARPAVSAAAARSAADDEDEELAALVRPTTGSGQETDLAAGEVPAFLAARPASSPPVSGTSARPQSSVGQARPAARGLRRPARIDADAPAWETPRRFEAYPTLRTRVGIPRVPTIALAIVALLAAALLLFVLPSFLAGPTSTPTPTPSSSVASDAPITPEPSPTPQVYVIVAGDTISKIARQFDITPEELLAANPQVTNPNRIKVGDELTIPAPEVAPSEDAAPSDEASPSP